MNKIELIINLVRELKLRGINVLLKINNQTVESKYINDNELCELVNNYEIQSIYVETLHGKKLIKTLYFTYSFDNNSLLIIYKNGRVKLIELYN